MPGAVLLRSIAIYSAGVALLLAGTMVALGSSAPPNSQSGNPGFQQALLWFEFVIEGQEVGAIFGSNPEDAERLRRTLDLVNRIDFAFLVAYPMYCFALLSLLRLRARGGEGLRLLEGSLILLLSLAMSIGDALENLSLLRLSDVAIAPEEIAVQIQSLRFWSDLKWIAIFVHLLLCAGFAWQALRRQGAVRLLWINLLPAGAALLGLAAVLGRHIGAADWRAYVEIASLGLSLSWLLGLAYAIWSKPTTARRGANEVD